MYAASGIDWIGCHRRRVARRKKRWEGENESRLSEEGAAKGTKKGWYFARWLLIIVVPARKSNFSRNGRNTFTIRSFINCNLYLFVSFSIFLDIYIYIVEKCIIISFFKWCLRYYRLILLLFIQGIFWKLLQEWIFLLIKRYICSF